METKDLALLMGIAIISLSILHIYKNPSITGAVTAKQEENNIIGAYSIIPSFKANINYDLNDYASIKASLNFIIKCSENNGDVEACTKQAEANDHRFEWSLNCDKGAEKVLYDFAEFYQDCFDSEDSNCLCRKDMKFSDEDLKKYDLSNKQFRMDLVQNADYKEIKIKMIEPNTDLTYDIKIKSKSRSTWYPNTFVLAYVKNKIELIFRNTEDSLMKQDKYTYALPPENKELILYKNKINDIDSVDFVKREGNNLLYPNDNVITGSENKPININNIPLCNIKPKNIYRFCVTKKDSRLMAYDKSDNQIKERDVTIKLSAYIPNKAQTP